MRYRTAAGDVAIQKSADGYRFYLYDDAVPTVKLGEAQANELLQEIKNGLETNEADVNGGVDDINVGVGGGPPRTSVPTSNNGELSITRINSEKMHDNSAALTNYRTENVQEVTKNAPEGARMALKDTIKKLDVYSDEEIASIEKTAHFKAARSYQDISEFIQSSIHSKAEQRLFLGKIGKNASEKILNETGVDVSGKSIALSSSDVAHIFNRHGDTNTEAPQGQIAITRQNFEDIIETIIEPDAVTKGDDTGGLSLVFQKNIRGSVSAVTIVSEKKKTLTLKSAHITNKKQLTSLSLDASAPSSTAKTGQRMKTASDSIIHQDEAVVNTSGEKSTALSSNDKSNDKSNDNSKKQTVRERVTANRISAWVRENVEGFEKLNASEQLRVKSIAISAAAHGFSNEDIGSICRVAMHSGLDISFDRSKLRIPLSDDPSSPAARELPPKGKPRGEGLYADGMYLDGVIYIDPQSERAIPALLSHEMIHAVYGKDAKKMLKLAYKNMSKAERDAIAEAYGIKNDSSAELREEIAAHYAEKILGSEAGLSYLWSEEPTLKEKILGFFKSAKNDYESDEQLSSAARRFANQYRMLFKKLEASGGLGAYRSGESRKAVGGIKAITADKLKLATAEKMLANGVDSETVRQETGWFKGYDGKWRFEIDDSKMTVVSSDLEYLKNAKSTLLGYLIKHDELFEAYPELRNLYVRVKDLNDNSGGYYSRTAKEITLNSYALDNFSEHSIKEVLIHETQHAVQDIEGFASGNDIGKVGTKEYLRTAGEIEAYDTAARIDYNAEERKQKRPDIDRSDVVFAEDGGVSYEIKKDGNGKTYWHIETKSDIFKNCTTPQQYRDAAFEFLIKNRDNKVTVKDSNGNEVQFIRLSAEEFTNSEESQDLFSNNPDLFEKKMQMIPSLENILLNSNVNWHSPDLKNHKLFKQGGFENFRGRVRIDNVIFNTVVRIGVAKFGEVFYDINIEVDKYLPHTKSASDINMSTSIDNSISQNSDLSTDNTKKNSLSPDGKASGEIADGQYQGRGAYRSGESRKAISQDKKITVGMSDSERAEILSNKEISAPIYRGEANASIESNIADLESRKRTVVENALIRIADEFNAKGNYKIEDVELEVSFSNKSIRESSNKSITDPKKLAKLLPILSDSVKKAIGIETHDNRYYYDNITKRFHELVGGYIDGDSFVPVRFGVKELNDGSCILYVVICQEKIKTEVLGIQAAEKSASHTPRPVNISIAQIAKNVNSQNKDLLRYFPDGLLNEEQRKAKNEAIAETVEYTNAKNDKAYIEAIKKGDIRNAKIMLQNAAKAAGYSSDNSWKMDHTAPNSTDGYSNSMDQIDKSYNSDGSIYSPKAAYYYGEGRSYDKKAISVIRSARSNPEKLITVYRAVPSNVKESRMRNGDWVTIVKEYAAEHGERMFDGDYRIIESTVPAKELFSNGDSINEWGYDNGNPNEVYKNTENNVKLLEPTYDDSGRLIPISKRFDDSKSDRRYALKNSGNSDKVTVSKGQRAVERANVRGERVFSKTSVQSALKSITGFDKMPRDLREELVNDVWRGFNNQLYDENYLKYSGIIAGRIRADILQELSFEVTESEIRGLEKQIKTALDTMITEAKPSARTKMEKQLEAENDSLKLKEELYRTRSSFKVMQEISKVAGDIKELKVGKYKNAAEGQSEIFSGLLKRLARVVNNSNTLNVSGTRGIMRDLAVWYLNNRESFFEYENDQKPGLWNQDIYNKMVELGDGSKNSKVYTVDELKDIYDVMSHFKTFVNNYGKIWRSGNLVEALPIAKKYVEIIRENEQLHKDGALSRIVSNL